MDAIGIDFGSFNCCVAYVNHNVVEVVPDRLERRLTSSYVTFTDTEELCGDIARERRHRNTLNTVYDLKRILGRTASDPFVTRNLLKKKWKYSIEDEDGILKIRIKQRNAEKLYEPEEICAILLKHLKREAEFSLGFDIKKAVVTCPVHYDDNQRKALAESCKSAGFEAVELLNEPIAAVLIYNVDSTIRRLQNSLVVDFGGATLDVSLVQACDGNLRVLASGHNLELGGNTIDKDLFNHFQGRVYSKYDYETYDSFVTNRISLEMCEDIKKRLSVSVEAESNLEEVYLKMTREKFDKLIDIIPKTMMVLVKDCVDDSRMSFDDIHEVLLVGGSCNVISVKAILERSFPNRVKMCIQPDEVLALGAAVMAHKLWAVNDSKQSPVSLGVEMQDGKMCVFIPKSSRLPMKKSKVFCTTVDAQKFVKVSVYCGEYEDVKDNMFLNFMILSEFKRGPAEYPKFRETFELDEGLNLKVTVTDLTTKVRKLISVDLSKVLASRRS